MRKYVKQKILDVLLQMEQSEDKLARLCEKQNRDAILLLLEELQQTAMEVGSEAEATEGEDSRFIHLLEDYCELLWQCGESDNRQEQLKKCRLLTKKRNQAMSVLKLEIPERLEVVFLPYKASMWDSLESVWMAADKDESCDAYVVPIPYYDKQQDGSFGEMHCEANQMPDYVPVVDYRDYRISERHPDVIFIHNPYDETNFVTSVHPDFYSSVLKNYTNMLAYIPYYIAAGDIPEEHCCTIGVLNSNRVFVWSERVRQTFLRVIKREYNVTEEMAEKIGLNNKFVALGSPKIDKLLNTKREDIVLPTEWRQKIYGENE